MTELQCALSWFDNPENKVGFVIDAANHFGLGSFADGFTPNQKVEYYRHKVIQPYVERLTVQDIADLFLKYKGREELDFERDHSSKCFFLYSNEVLKNQCNNIKHGAQLSTVKNQI